MNQGARDAQAVNPAPWRARPSTPAGTAAAAILEEQYKVQASVYSVTSYKELYMEANEAARWNLLNPGETPRKAYITGLLERTPGVTVAVSDFVKALPESIARWVPGTLRTRAMACKRRPVAAPGAEADGLRAAAEPATGASDSVVYSESVGSSVSSSSSRSVFVSATVNPSSVGASQASEPRGLTGRPG